MKYKALDEPITRREACLILDRKRFDGLVRVGDIQPVGKRSLTGSVAIEDGRRTAPLLFDQEVVREWARAIGGNFTDYASHLRAEAKAASKRTQPYTKRQIARILGPKQTGVLVRSGRLAAAGKLTDTQTAAHTFEVDHVRDVLLALAEEALADSRLLARSAKARIPA